MNPITATAATAVVCASFLTATATMMVAPNANGASVSSVASTATGVFAHVSPAYGRHTPPVLAVAPSGLTDEEVVRRFTRATEVLLVGYARYQEAEAAKGGKA